MKIRNIGWGIPMIGIFGFLSCCVEDDGLDTNTNTDEVMDEGDADGVEADDEAILEKVDVLQLGNFFYPTGFFLCGRPEADDPEPSTDCPDGAGCDDHHWHSETVRAIEAVMSSGGAVENAITDPNPCKCGHGKVGEVMRTTISINESDVIDYLDAMGLNDLPEAVACPPEG